MIKIFFIMIPYVVISVKMAIVFAYFVKLCYNTTVVHRCARMSGIPWETASDDRNYHGRCFEEPGRCPEYKANGVII